MTQDIYARAAMATSMHFKRDQQHVYLFVLCFTIMFTSLHHFDWTGKIVKLYRKSKIFHLFDSTIIFLVLV